MPMKPKRSCSYPNCPNLTDGRFCEENQRLENKRYEKYERNPATRKRYGATWRKVRASYVKAHPYCKLCYQNGVMKEVEEVHYKKLLSQEMEQIEEEEDQEQDRSLKVQLKKFKKEKK